MSLSYAELRNGIVKVRMKPKGRKKIDDVIGILVDRTPTGIWVRAAHGAVPTYRFLRSTDFLGLVFKTEADGSVKCRSDVVGLDDLASGGATCNLATLDGRSVEGVFAGVSAADDVFVRVTNAAGAQYIEMVPGDSVAGITVELHEVRQPEPVASEPVAETPSPATEPDAFDPLLASAALDDEEVPEHALAAADDGADIEPEPIPGLEDDTEPHEDAADDGEESSDPTIAELDDLLD